MGKLSTGPYVRDVVLPIVEATWTKLGELGFVRHLGTGFLVGNPSKLITASHVVDGIENAVAMRIVDGRWMSIDLRSRSSHPTEDICVINIDAAEPLFSFMVPTSAPQFSSGNYQVWGYPEDILFDQGARDPRGRILQQPDLIYSAGHIRRRASVSFPGLRGSSFYELSAVAGAGVSGAPVIISVGPLWRVIGVYVGERTVQNADRPPREWAYAVRFDGVLDWLGNEGVALSP